MQSKRKSQTWYHYKPGEQVGFAVSVPPLQADIMEILYRAAKQDSLKDVNIAFQGLPKVKAVFEYLVAKPLQVPQP